jgi:hypothetical protein
LDVDALATDAERTHACVPLLERLVELIAGVDGRRRFVSPGGRLETLVLCERIGIDATTGLSDKLRYRILYEILVVSDDSTSLTSDGLACPSALARRSTWFTDVMARYKSLDHRRALIDRGPARVHTAVRRATGPAAYGLLSCLSVRCSLKTDPCERPRCL